MRIFFRYLYICDYNGEKIYIYNYNKYIYILKDYFEHYSLKLFFLSTVNIKK